MICFTKKVHQRTTARIGAASSTRLVGVASHFCRAVKWVGGVLWLLSSTLAFGQSNLMLCPAALEPQTDSEPFPRSEPSTDQVRSTLSSTPPLHRLSDMPAERTGLSSLPNRTDAQPHKERSAHAFEIKPIQEAKESRGFRWGPALGQSFLFLAMEHSARLAFDPPSRTAFTGKFWKEYVASLREVNEWGDGNPMFINYLGHPMQGSVAGFIQIQNDPAGRSLPISWSQRYWTSRLKALAWSAAYSTYFEIGFPFSEAAMGNLGVDKNRQTQQGLVDLVITPTLGFAWLVSEDLIDSHVVDRFERSHSGKVGQALIRSALNPTRSFSNLLRFKPPWHRDGRHLGARRSDVLKTAMHLDREKTKEDRPIRAAGPNPVVSAP